MHFENLEQARKLVIESAILSPGERAEWTQLLPQMNDNQILELIKILVTENHAGKNALAGHLAANASAVQSQPQKVPVRVVQPQAQNSLPNSVPNQLAQKIKIFGVDINEKELTGATLDKPEKELPEHATVKPVGMPERPKIVPAKVVPANVFVKPSIDASSLNATKTQRVAVKQAKPEADTSVKPKEQVPYFPKVAEFHPQAHIVPPPVLGQLNKYPNPTPQPLNLKNEEDFSHLEPSIMHGTNPALVMQNLLSVILEMSKEKKYLMIIYNLEKSPLYHTYVRCGTMLLNDPDADPAACGMTKQEFEAFTDFRKELDNLVV